MNTKEASAIFNIPEKELRRLCKENKVSGAKLVKGKYEIPDDTLMIITDENAKAFLFQLLKFKNNPDLVLSYKGFDTVEKRHIWHSYLLNQGFISLCSFIGDTRNWLNNMTITDDGLGEIFGTGKQNKLLNMSISPTVNVNIASLVL